jgi:hypothetical protein
MTAPSGTFRESDESPVPMADAKLAWADVARSVLERVATKYDARINYGELAEEIQDRSGIRTRMLMHYWIGDVLGTVSRGCHAAGEPLLSSLCVHQDGTIGDGYAIALAEAYGGEAPADLEMHAAEERLKCYRYFGADVPAAGGRPRLPRQIESRRFALARRQREDTPPLICPTCNLALPKTGRCDNCSP